MTINTTEQSVKTVRSTPRSMEDDGQLITWTEYHCGAVLLGSGTDTNSEADLILHGCDQRGPITLSYLTDLADDLLCLANDPGVRAMLPPGDASPERSNNAFDQQVVQAAIVQKQTGLPMAPAGTIHVERHSMPDGEQERFWTDYTCGSVLLGVHDDDNRLELILDGHDMSDFPVTQASIRALSTDLLALLADPRLQAALPADLPVAPAMPSLGCPRCGGDLALNLQSLLYHCEQPRCHWAGLRPDLAALGDTTHLVVATIDDAPVVVTRYVDDDEPAVMGGTSITWQGAPICASGDEAIHLPDAETGISDDLHEKHFSWLKAAMAADVFPRLMAIARRYRDQPWPMFSVDTQR